MAWNGHLNVNEIFSSLYNMIISQTIYMDNISTPYDSLVNRARAEGSLYGDTMLFVSVDANETYPFSADASHQLNVLATHRPKNPDVQKIELNVFRQIPVTIDNYFSKRAFENDSTFADFNGAIIGWLRDTKRIYDLTEYNVFIGTNETDEGSQMQEISLTGITESATTSDDEAHNRLEAEIIANGVADILVSVEDISRDYNDNGYIRAFGADELLIVWNAAFVNKFKNIDLPTIFNGDGLFDIAKADTLPSRYFGTAVEAGTTSAANVSIRAKHEMYIDPDTNAEIDWDDYTPDNLPAGTVHLFAGDLLPGSTAYTADNAYEVDDTVVCKIMAKGSVPYMSAFETETEFINARNLSQNHYLTFGHNTLEHLKNYPYITVKVVTE